MRWVIYIFAILIICMVALLGAISSYPQWFVDQVDARIANLSIKHSGLEFSWFPIELKADALNLETDSFAIEARQATARFHLWDFLQTQPYWNASIEHLSLVTDDSQTQAQSNQATDASTADSVGLPGLEVLFSVQSLTLDQLVQRASSELDSDAVTVTDVSATNDGTQMNVAGKLIVPDLQLHTSTVLRRKSQHPPTSEVQVTGEYRLVRDGSEHALTIEKGVLAWQPVEASLWLRDIAGYHTSPAEDGASAQTESLAVTLALKEILHEAQLDLSLSYGQTQLQLTARAHDDNTRTTGNLSLSSRQLPGNLTDAWYAATEIYPLTSSLDFQLSDVQVDLKSWQFDAPAIKVQGKLHGTKQVDGDAPWQWRGALNAASLLLPLPSPGENLNEVQQSGQGAEAALDTEQQDRHAPLFDETPIDWSWLSGLDVEFPVTISHLDARRLQLSELVLGIQAIGGQASLKPITGRLGQGDFDGAVDVQLGEDGVADAQIVFTASAIEPGALGLSDTTQFSGGPVHTNVQLTSSVQSPAMLAQNLSGEISLRMDELRVQGSALNIIGGDVISQLLSKLNPFAKSEEDTVVQCASVLLNVSQGDVKSAEQVVVETDKMRIESDINIALLSEDLDIVFRPRAKSGLGIGVGDLAKVVKLGGTLQTPRLEVDALGVVESGATVGAALATGGMSLLAQGLIGRTLGDSGCAQEANVLPLPEEQEVQDS